MKNKNRTAVLLKILAFLCGFSAAAAAIFGIIFWDFQFSLIVSAGLIILGAILFGVLYGFGENIRLISEINEHLKSKND